MVSTWKDVHHHYSLRKSQLRYYHTHPTVDKIVKTNNTKYSEDVKSGTHTCH